MKKKIQTLTLMKTLPYILLIGGFIGTLSSFLLTTENIDLIEHPTQSLICDINPIISCGSVMRTWQASAFGFPNSIIGMVGFAYLAFVGLAMLAGATFKRWFWLLTEASIFAALMFTFWFQYQSFTSINALCPFCLVVWVVTIPLFLYTTLYVFREGYIKTPKKLAKPVSFVQKHHVEVLYAWYLVIALMILNHFWYYWQTLL